MTYADDEVSAASVAIEKYRSREDEVGSALVVVGLSAERAARDAAVRDDMIRVAHRAGASVRRLAEVSGLNGKTVTAIIAKDDRASD